MIKLNFFKTLLLLAAIPLLVAYVAQYIFGLLPCKLCIYQRIPYIAIIIICAQALWLGKLPLISSYGLIFVFLLVSISLAAFHFGVEMGWVQHHSSCTFSHEGVNSFEQYKLMLESADLVSCDMPTPLLFGISMVGWNLIYGLLITACFVWLYKNKRLANHI